MTLDQVAPMFSLVYELSFVWISYGTKKALWPACQTFASHMYYMLQWSKGQSHGQLQEPKSQPHCKYKWERKPLVIHWLVGHIYLLSHDPEATLVLPSYNIIKWALHLLQHLHLTYDGSGWQIIFLTRLCLFLWVEWNIMFFNLGLN